MKNAAEPAFIDELLGQRDRRHAAVVVPDHVRHSGLLDGLDHLQPFGAVHRERLFAQDHFAGFGGGDGDFRVHVVGAGDIDQVDVVRDRCSFRQSVSTDS